MNFLTAYHRFASSKIKMTVAGFLNRVRSLNSPFLRVPAGHYYSPLPSKADLEALESNTPNDIQALAGIDLREQEQVDLLKQLSNYYHDIPFTETPQENLRYYFGNEYYSFGDGIILFCMLRHFQPARVVEIGSGFSSALMLDTDQLYLGNRTQFTFIEPYPRRLHSLLSGHGHGQSSIIAAPIQNVSIELFDALDHNDFLVIDSSHVAKLNSDVLHLIFRVLPRLKPGVLIHFHDIHWPFEYSLEALRAGYAWNEAYFVRAFLMFNSAFQILYFNSFMGAYHAGLLHELMPKCCQNIGGSLWLRRR